MGIIKKVTDYFTERRRSKLRKDLEAMCEMDFQYNPFKYNLPAKLVDEAEDIKRLCERAVWYSGIGVAIYDFYNGYKRVTVRHATYVNHDVNIKESYFWVATPPEMRHIHSGLPNLISDTMGRILFGNGYKIVAEIKDENDKVKEKDSKVASELITELCDELKLPQLFKDSAVTNSWSGHVDFKLNYDLSLTYKPIVEFFDRRFFSLRKVRGVTIEHVFSQWYNKSKDKTIKGENFLHEEIYTTNEYGYSVIENHLYLLDGDLKKEVALSTIPETRNLESKVTLKTKGILAFDIPNLGNVNTFLHYPYGKSDYEGAIDSFDSFDEVTTQIVNEIRDKKPIREWDERAFDTDSEGNKTLIKYITNYIKLPHSNAEDSSIVKSTEFTDETQSHLQKWNTMLAMCCANCKISPISLGIPGTTAIDSSASTLREKSKTTTETRKAKIELYQPFMEKFIKELLRFAKYITTLSGYNNQDIDAIEWKKKLDSLDLDKIKIKVQFNDYLVDAKESRINTAVNAVGGNVMSIETAIEDIHGDDWTPQQKQDEVNRILFRMGMAQEEEDLRTLESVNVENTEDSIINEVERTTEPQVEQSVNI